MRRRVNVTHTSTSFHLGFPPQVAGRASRPTANRIDDMDSLMQMLRDKTEDVNEYHAEQAKVCERWSLCQNVSGRLSPATADAFERSLSLF